LACACLLSAGQSQASETKEGFAAALVIGNARYTSVGELKNPEHDADGMCAALSSMGFQTTCRKNVETRAVLRAVIEDFVDTLPSQAIGVIYYAGHGLQVRGENYLVPTQARIRDEASVLRETVNLSFLMGQLRLRRNPGYLTIVILDACRNDPVSSIGVSLPMGLAPITATGLPEATDVLYATAANRTAIDDAGRNGTLTKHLLTQLSEHVPVDDLFKRVIDGVQSETEHTQTPEYYGNFTGKYCFGGCRSDLDVLKQQEDAEMQKHREELEAANHKVREAQRRQQEAEAAAQEARKKPKPAPVVPVP
jgi:hypothetical protein